MKNLAINLEGNMRQLQFSFRDIAEILNAKRNPSYRILMEKERKGLSYIDLQKKINKTAYNEEYIRKSILSKKIQPELVSELNKVLEISKEDEEFTESVLAYRYYKNKKRRKGAISDIEKEKNKELYNKLKMEIENDGGSTDEALIMESYNTELYCYEGIPCDRDMYDEFMEEDLKKDILKKILIINDLFPEKIEDFISKFKFDEEDNAELETLKIEIKYC